MPKIAKVLGPLAVSRLSGNRAHPVGGVAGLMLKIDGASRSWVLRVTVGGHRRSMGLGPYPAVNLAQAREKAQSLREEVVQGNDPLRKKAAAKVALKLAQASAITFEQAARDYISHHESSWTNAKHAGQWLSSLEKWAFPRIGSLQLADITSAHVLDVLRQQVDEKGIFWNVRTETATRVRQRIEKIINAADVNAGLDRLNPARLQVIGQTLPQIPKARRVKHYPSLPWQRIPDFFMQLVLREGTSAKAVAWTIFTGARSNETRGMTWAELDLDKKVWTVPAKRMKGGREHRVPLTDTAISFLGEAGKPAEFVFPGANGGRLSDMSLSAVIKRMHQESIENAGPGWTDPKMNNRVATVHGMRSSFRSWGMDESVYPRELLEMALSHKVGDATEQAYARNDQFDKRRSLMVDWHSYFCTSSTTDASHSRGA